MRVLVFAVAVVSFVSLRFFHLCINGAGECAGGDAELKGGIGQFDLSGSDTLGGPAGLIVRNGFGASDKESFKTLDAGARAEILELFPQLEAQESFRLEKTARCCIKSSDGALFGQYLAARQDA